MEIDKNLFKKESYENLAINNIIYEFIKPDSRVLDLGCGNGILGEFLKKNKYCYVDGLELDRSLAEIAKSKLDNVVCADIQDLHKSFANKRYDYIVCGDILEHLQDPMPVLNNIKSLLMPRGYLLASIPNVANWLIRIGLLMGNFEYKPLTITDPGHLRFYTKATAERLLQSAGYRVVHVFSKNSAYKRDFIMRWLGRVWGSLFAYQFIFAADIEEKI